MYQIETDISIYVCICDSVFIYMYVYYICIIKEFTINIYLSIYSAKLSRILFQTNYVNYSKHIISLSMSEQANSKPIITLMNTFQSVLFGCYINLMGCCQLLIWTFLAVGWHWLCPNMSKNNCDEIFHLLQLMIKSIWGVI